MGFLDDLYKEINDKKEDIVVKEYGYEANKNGNPRRKYLLHMSELEFNYVVDESNLNPDEIEMFHDVLDRINKMRREINYSISGNQKEKTEELEWDDVMYDDKQYETVYDYERDMFYELLKKINKKRKNRVV